MSFLQKLAKKAPPVLVEWVKRRHKQSLARRDYEREFTENYDPSRKTALLCRFPRKHKAYWHEFFGEDQVLCVTSSRQLTKALAFVNAANTTVYVKGKRRAHWTEGRAKAAGASVAYLTRGMIGHPLRGNLPACFMLHGAIRNYEAFDRDKAAQLRRLYRELRIGYGQAPSGIDTEKYLGMKLKERVLVLPTKGSRNPFRRKTKLLDRAVRENPDADVYLYRSGRKRTAAPVRMSVVIDGKPRRYFRVSKPLRAADMIIACDRVYTDRAPAAIDAIFYDKPLTVTGEPFYKGFRADNLFGVVFLKCTKYAYGNGDAVLGLLATMLDVAGHYEIEGAKCGSLPRPPVGPYFNRAFAAETLGRAARNGSLKPAFASLKADMPAADLGAALYLLVSLSPSGDGLKEIEALLEEEGGWPEARAILKSLLRKGVAKESGLAEAMHAETELRIADTLLAERQHEEAEAACLRMLLSGVNVAESYVRLADIAATRFAFEDAAALLSRARRPDRPALHAAADKQRAGHCYVAGDAEAFLRATCAAVKRDPSFIAPSSARKDLLSDRFGALPWEEALFLSSHDRLALLPKGDAETLALARGSMAFERFEEQIAMLERMGAPKRELPRALQMMEACMFLGRTQEARAIAEQAIAQHPTQQAFRLAIALAVRMDAYDWAQEIFAKAEKRGMKKGGASICEVAYRKYCFGIGAINEAYRSYRDMKPSKFLREYLPEKYFQSVADVPEGAKNILITACFGPGDEIRFASLYPQMDALFPEAQATFSCEPRLEALFRRSYPELHFLPVARLRSLNYKTDLSKYRDMPGADLHIFFDNKGWGATEWNDGVTLATDLLGDVIESKDSISGAAYLTPCETKRKFWKNRVKSDRIKIGLSWRSSLNTYSRNEHYLSIEELNPLLDAFDGRVEFFNFQYDKADEELEWAVRNCRHALTNFEDLDQYNDLDSVAALMSCMDLMISPATTVVELAGALGCPTLLLSNSSELHWRKREDGTDVWHSSVRHVEGDIVGDKASLVRNLVEEVRKLYSASGQYRASS